MMTTTEESSTPPTEVQAAFARAARSTEIYLALVPEAEPRAVYALGWLCSNPSYCAEIASDFDGLTAREIARLAQEAVTALAPADVETVCVYHHAGQDVASSVLSRVMAARILAGREAAAPLVSALANACMIGIWDTAWRVTSAALVGASVH